MTEPLRVAFDMTFPNRNQAGSGVYAFELLAELRKRDDVAMDVVALEGDGWSRTVPWLISGVRQASAGDNLLHCPAFVAPWRAAKPLVLTVHDVSANQFPGDHTLEWRAYTRLFLADRARSAARVITGTEFSRREIVDQLGVRPERISVTPYGVPAQFLSLPPSNKPVADPPLLLFPGAPTRRKNLELVLRALAESPPQSVLRRGRLVITGATADRFPAHATQIKEMGLDGRVEWRGKLPAGAMPPLVTGADLVVYPSLHEGFGFPALEAMAAGTPVIASNAGCLPEVLGDGALLVDPNRLDQFISAAESLLTNQDVRCDLVARGRARAARYSWARCADQTVDVYREALANR